MLRNQRNGGHIPTFLVSNGQPDRGVVINGAVGDGRIEVLVPNEAQRRAHGEHPLGGGAVRVGCVQVDSAFRDHQQLLLWNLPGGQPFLSIFAYGDMLCLDPAADTPGFAVIPASIRGLGADDHRLVHPDVGVLQGVEIIVAYSVCDEKLCGHRANVRKLHADAVARLFMI